MPIHKLFVLGAAILMLSQCSQPAPKGRWALLVAPSLMHKTGEGEPCTGTPYVRAPLSDWEKLGEYDSFQQCAAAISAPNPDTSEAHQKGKLSPGELMLGFRCVQTDDVRLSSRPPYNWKTETIAEE